MGRETECHFEVDAAIIIEALSNFYERSVSGESPVIHQPPLSELVADMELSALIQEGGADGREAVPFHR